MFHCICKEKRLLTGSRVFSLSAVPMEKKGWNDNDKAMLNMEKKLEKKYLLEKI